MNPKALNLDVILNTNRKVTLGFKCTPSVKIQLAKEANEFGYTLSNYVEQLIDNALQGGKDINEQEVEGLTATIKELEEKVSFYETPLLKQLFKDYNNEIIDYKNTAGDIVKIKITKIEDVFTVIINSFKPTKE